MMRLTPGVFCVLALFAAGSQGWSQDSKTGVTDLFQVDADFYIQGDYFGSMQLDGYCRSVGLQVVALGDGQFDALLYRGGLPGNGYDGSPKLKLSGGRIDPLVVLNGENLVVNL